MPELSADERREIGRQLRARGFSPHGEPSWTAARTAYALGVAAGRAAQLTDDIAQAEQVKAVYLTQKPRDNGSLHTRYEPFAGLLRQNTPPGDETP